jgi:transposase
VRSLIEKKGCKLLYLPAYSPDYNPIEYSFSVIKAALRNEFQVKGNESVEELAEIAIKAAENAVTKEIARNQFRHCHIRVPTQHM